jgi:hypothetical protein
VLTWHNTGTFTIDSVTDTNTIVLASGASTVDDAYNGLLFRREAPTPRGLASVAQSRSGGHYMVTDYTGGTLTLDFTPALIDSGDFVAGENIVIGPSLPAAFSELNIGGGGFAFRIAEVVSGVSRTDYEKIGAGLFRTYGGVHGGRGQLTHLYILSENAGGDTIHVEYK